ncbi:hypothetical protein LTS18_014452, partial [Coniosporium uncinatum]
GSATSMDTAARTVTIAAIGAGGLGEGKEQTLPYHALIIATGTKTASPMMSLCSETATHETVITALQRFHAQLPSAKSIIIAGGGPAGVETAGELGEQLNGIAGWFRSRPKEIKVKITLITGDEKLLPALRPALARKAESMLNKVGVDVIYSQRVTSVAPEGAGTLEFQEKEQEEKNQNGPTPTTVTLQDGTQMQADLYVPATGVGANTSFAPKDILTEKGFIETNEKTLRVDAAGERVYALGDVGSYTRGGILDIFDAVPICLTNVKKDLLAYAKAAEDERLALKVKGPDRVYKPNLKETQLVPIGTKWGVGAVFGWRLPSFMIWLIKGRDYMASNAPKLTFGYKWIKESKWKVDS